MPARTARSPPAPTPASDFREPGRAATASPPRSPSTGLPAADPDRGNANGPVGGGPTGPLCGRSVGGLRLPQTPLLVGLTVAGPQNQLRAVGCAGAVGVQAQPRLHAGDRAVA